jgi:RNA polymerase-associated protein CTR9
LLYAAGKTSEEDALLKEANAGHAKDPLLRAYITHYLVRNEKWKDASEYASQTRRGNQDDVHALCALGAYHYHLARESKGSEAERTRDYCRSGEAFSRALEVDPKCAVAAQGLAIAIAEDHLPLRRAGQNGDAAVVRNRGLDVALSIFTRIRDCMGGKSVSINMGHIYANKGDEEKAIETVSSTGALVLAFENAHQKWIASTLPLLTWLTDKIHRFCFSSLGRITSWEANSKVSSR